MHYLRIVEEIRRKYPTPLGARHWEFLVDVAQATETRLFRKEAGDNVLIPPLGKRVSGDIIGRGSLGDQHADILFDQEGTAAPIFVLKSGAAGEYVDVSAIRLPDAPPDEPDPPPPADGDVDARLRAVEQQLARVVAALRPLGSV